MHGCAADLQPISQEIRTSVAPPRDTPILTLR